MKKVLFNLHTLLFISLISLFSCNEAEQEDDNIMRYLEENAKINTFPLVVITSDRLSGEAFPEDIQRLCAVSKQTCKTLPVSGIVRLGHGVYYNYNCLGELKVNDSLDKNESALTGMVEQQVNAYHSKTTLKDYDSLLSPNHPKWNIKTLSLNYVSNTADSVFFFSNIPNSPSLIRVGTREYNVFNSTTDLRRMIDDIICQRRATISVFYNPFPFDSSKVSVASTKWAKKGTDAGDTCVEYSKYEKHHNGSGGFMLGDLIEANSVSCGFVFPTGRAGDTCVSGSRFQKMHNGRGGFSVGNLIERNSRSCGFVFPTGRAGDTCVNGSRFQKMHNGSGGFNVGSLIERNSRSCGFVFPTGRAGDTCVSGSRFQKMHNGRGGFSVGSLIERNSRSCGFVFPTGRAGDTCVSGSRFQKMHNGRGGFSVGSLIERNSRSCGLVFPTGRAGDTCVNGSRYQRMHNGRGGFSVGSLIERNSRNCGFEYPSRGIPAPGFVCYNGSKYAKLHDGKGAYLRGTLIEANSSDCEDNRSANECVRKSDPLCEQDSRGNYTGRRVQYCYNQSGSIIQTIVLSKCDSDCRCF